MNKPTLGYLRVIFALSVMDTHFGFYRVFFNHVLAPIFLHIFKNPHFYFLGDGHVAVFGFFMLSGYLVANISTSKYKNPNLKALIHFTITRYTRIYPLYIVVFLGFFVLLRPHVNLGFLIYNTLLPYGLLAFFDAEKTHLFASLLIPQSWTLCYDVVFYPIGAILSFYRKYSYLFFLGFFGLFLMSALKFDEASFLFNTHNFFHLYLYSVLDVCLLPFLIGIFVYLYKSQIPKSRKLFILSIAFYIYICYVPIFLNPSVGYILSMSALGYLVFYLGENGRSLIESFLGNFTYSVYLIHLPLYIHFIHNRISAFFVSLFLAFILAISVENYFEKIRHKMFRYHTYSYENLSFLAFSISIIMFFSSIFYIPFVSLWHKSYISKPRTIGYYQDHWMGGIVEFDTFKNPLYIFIDNENLPRHICVKAYPQYQTVCKKANLYLNPYSFLVLKANKTWMPSRIDKHSKDDRKLSIRVYMK